MYMIEITEKKINKLSDHIEESLRHLDKVMQCVDEWMQERGEIGERNNSSNENSYGRYGNRERDYVNYRYDDWDDEMNERRRYRGRYRG